MSKMRAVLVPEFGGPEKLEIGTCPRPETGPADLLVRVHATALNRADILQREGKYPPPPGESEILGLEVAGVVEEKGEDCPEFAVGDRVFGLLAGGGYAEYARLPKGVAMRIPDRMSVEEAAAIPEAFLTAYQALFLYGQVSMGHRVLIHAGASGVGTAAIQLAREAGALVYATASAGKHEGCRALGASRVIDYRAESFADVIRRETDGQGVDAIVDFIGGPYLNDNVASLAMDGRIVILATMGGSRVEQFDIRHLFRRRGQIITSTLRNRPLIYKEKLTAAFADFALPRFADGRLKPVIDRMIDWSDVADAHRAMEANKNVGKIVLRVNGAA